jgi:hypothetical protein
VSEAPQYTTHRPASATARGSAGMRIRPEQQHATRPVPIPLPARAGLTTIRDYATTESAPAHRTKLFSIHTLPNRVLCYMACVSPHR